MRTTPPQPTARRAARSRHRLVIGAVLLAATTAVAGCQVRWESPDPVVPTPSAIESARQLTARESAEIAELARTLPEDFGIADEAHIHLEVLGGVWEPWPGSGPDATAFPDATAPSASPSWPTNSTESTDRLSQELRAGAVSARERAVEHGRTAEGVTFASISISRALAADRLSGSDSLSEETVFIWRDTSLAAQLDAEAADAVDAARFVYEVAAARLVDDDRETARGRAADLEQLALDARSPFAIARRLGDSPATGSPEEQVAAEHDLAIALIGAVGARAPSQLTGTLVLAAQDAALRAQSGGHRFSATPGLSE